jgi:zinc protease
MAKMFLILSLMLIFAASISAQSFFPYKYEQTTLDNGLKVITIPIKNAGLVSYYTIVRAGSRDEVEPGKSGFAHFFEHIMFQGTKNFPAEKYNGFMMEMGADTNASTYDDKTVYYLHFPSRYLEKVIELQADKFMNTSYSKEDFQTEAKAILGEYNKNFANPFFQLEERLRDTAFEKSTYKHTAMGFLKDIQDMPNQYEYSLQFFNRFYRPDNSIILITGNFDPAQAITLIKKYYADWKPGVHKTENLEDPSQGAEKRAEVKYPGKTLPILAITYKMPAFSPESKDFASLFLLSRLAFGETSELYKKLVLDEQTVDVLQPNVEPHRDPYLFTVYVRLKNDKDLQNVETTITQAMEKFKSSPPDAKRLNDLKSNLKYGFLMALDTSRNTASNLTQYLALTQDIKGIDTTFQTFDSITPQEIQQAAAKYLSTDKRTIVTLTGGK